MKTEEKIQYTEHIKSLRESLNDIFLQKGGILLRRGCNKKGEPTIEQKKKSTKWQTRLTYTQEEFRDKAFIHLTSKKSKFFKSAEI